MIKLLAQELDICKVSKLFGKNKLKASITNSVIIIDSEEVADAVIDELFEYAVITSAQNYHDQNEAESVETEAKVEVLASDTENSIPEITHVEDEFTETLMVEIIDSEYHEESATSLINEANVRNEVAVSKKQISKSDLLYRGEVYKWGGIRKAEDGEGEIKECVIIIQNDYQTSASEDTIALFCTSNYQDKALIRFSFKLDETNLEEYSVRRLEKYAYCTMFVSHIKGIKRNELGKYLGKMNDRFMNTLQPTIDYCLGLKRSRTINIAQLQMLTNVKVEDLFAISNSKISNSKKVTEFLKLFNFDLNLKGVDYVKKAILVAYKLGDYTLVDLAEIIAQKEEADAKEVLRMIVARIKENFHFRKSPAISFIRLIDRLMKKGANSYGFNAENY